MKFITGLFAQRKSTATTAPKPEAVNRAEQDHEARVRRVHAERERAEAERIAAQVRADAEAIRRSCELVGHWWPNQPMPESRLTGRPTWRERLVELLFEAWRR
jgi:hypothetical protein